MIGLILNSKTNTTALRLLNPEPRKYKICRLQGFAFWFYPRRAASMEQHMKYASVIDIVGSYNY